MRKIIVMAASLLVLSTAAMAQQTETYPSYITVNGNAEREVTPNEIYVKIVIDESDSRSKVTVADQERKMVAELKKLGIDVEKDLQVGDMSGDLTNYVFRRDQVQTQKSYVLKVSSADMLNKVFQALGQMNISKMSLLKVTRNDLDKIRMELRTEAIKNAQTIAVTLAEAIGQKAGKAFMITDNNYGNGGVIYYDFAVTGARSKAEAAPAADDTTLEFQNIKLNCSVNARFVLE